MLFAKSTLFSDWTVNSGNAKGRIVLICFRLASSIQSVPLPARYFFYPYLIIYRVLIEWVFGIELPWKLKAGRNLRIYHGQSLVVNDKVVIGHNCILRHSTTIGVRETSESFDGQAPTIGNYVDIGANVVIVGNITIGDHVRIGAGAVVVTDAPAGSILVGNPARIVNVEDKKTQSQGAKS